MPINKTVQPSASPQDPDAGLVTSLLSYSAMCADFDPQSISRALREHPALNSLYTSSWTNSDGYAAALTADFLLQERLRPFKSRSQVNWTFLARPRLPSENNSFTQLCFDPNFYLDYWAGRRLSMDDLAPQRRVFLLTEVCGIIYLTDLSPVTVYAESYPIESVQTLSSIQDMQASLEQALGRQRNSYPAFSFGGRFFTPLNHIPEGHPYRHPTRTAPLDPANPRSLDDGPGAETTYFTMKLRRLFGVCPE